MNNLFLVAVADSRQDLSKLRSSLSLLHFPMNNEVIVELATGRVLHHEKHRMLGLNDLIELDDVGVVEGLHDADLSIEFRELLFIELSLVNDFNGDLN